MLRFTNNRSVESIIISVDNNGLDKMTAVIHCKSNSEKFHPSITLFREYVEDYYLDFKKHNPDFIYQGLTWEINPRENLALAFLRYSYKYEKDVIRIVVFKLETAGYVYTYTRKENVQ